MPDNLEAEIVRIQELKDAELLPGKQIYCAKAAAQGNNKVYYMVLAKDGGKSQIQGTPTGEPKGTYYLTVNPRGQLVRTNESDQKSQTKGSRLAQRDDYVLTVYADGTLLEECVGGEHESAANASDGRYLQNAEYR
ncbi:hypothetical protein SELMODRAFT_406464 [Selaginella moellendorffii]|uniref:Uncharacterized protein n=1 Tax=Selaginella moellendorffii TaxID=88036 RepID=D8R2F8_SELML|nr:hypothetical protein SELMODRAFT_406464 [Selaginella moellendorffii]